MELKEISEYEEVTGSPIWIRKMRTIFRRLDSNSHGYIEIDDLLDIAARLLTTYPKIEHFFGDQIVQAMVNLWYGVLCKNIMDSSVNSDKVNETVFLKIIQENANESLKTDFESLIVTPFFDLADSDHDGFILMSEFVSVMESWCANSKEAELVFRLVLGGDAKGKMSKKQFEGLLAEFFFSEDSKGKTNKLWGPLINYKRPEDYPECQCSPNWEGKMRTLFRRLDIKQSGKLRCHDFILIGRSLIHRNHLSKENSAIVIRSMLDIWVHFFSIDNEKNRHTELTEKQFIHNLRDLINGDFRYKIDLYGWTFFKTVEVERTGFLSLVEYRNLQESWQVGRDEAEGMFKVLDTDKDGRISCDEYMTAWVDYFLGEDPKSVYRTFFGPIVSKPV